jgi:hypothetical protein
VLDVAVDPVAKALSVFANLAKLGPEFCQTVQLQFKKSKIRIKTASPRALIAYQFEKLAQINPIPPNRKNGQTPSAVDGSLSRDEREGKAIVVARITCVAMVPHKRY